MHLMYFHVCTTTLHDHSCMGHMCKYASCNICACMRIYIYNNALASMHVVLMHAYGTYACVQVMKLYAFMRCTCVYECDWVECDWVDSALTNVCNAYVWTYIHEFLCVVYTCIYVTHMNIWMYRTHVFVCVCDTWGSRLCDNSINFQSRA